MTETNAHVRWMIRRDMPSVMSIEEQSFEFPWSEDTFIRTLRQRDCIGMVTEIGDEVAGRQGVGAKMVERLVAKLSFQRRNRIVLEVRETNLGAQLFFRKMGFRANRVLKEFYEDCKEDAYMMEYRAVD
jgi:[ribosomal protein S18]-alanine N-acetyltransferase